MSVWKPDEKLLIFASLISPPKIISYFQLSSRCLIWWWNTASHPWSITSNVWSTGPRGYTHRGATKYGLSLSLALGFICYWLSPVFPSLYDPAFPNFGNGSKKNTVDLPMEACVAEQLTPHPEVQGSSLAGCIVSLDKERGNPAMD